VGGRKEKEVGGSTRELEQMLNLESGVFKHALQGEIALCACEGGPFGEWRRSYLIVNQRWRLRLRDGDGDLGAEKYN